ncbi:MAG: DUF3987 domain-containing protein [Syntrophobacteraceae bacterium]
MWPDEESSPVAKGIPSNWYKKPYHSHWVYRGAGGAILGYVTRYQNTTEDKDVVPFFRQEGTGWKAKAAPVPRPLYGLDRLANNPDAPVMITEGEKAADAAQKLLPGYVSVTSPGGSKAAGKADWTPLKGRSCIVWPDNDEPGEKYAAAVAQQLPKVGATLKGVIDVQALGLPEKGDAADWPVGKPLPDPLPMVDPSSRSSNCSKAPCSNSQALPEPPRPLQRELPPPEEYPVDALGEILGGAAKAIHRAIQAPLAMCAQSVLAAACLATQGLADFTIDGRQGPISEYFLTIGESGERKTAVDNVTLLEHRNFQQELAENYAREYRDFMNSAEAFKKAREEALKKAKGYHAKNQALADLGDPPTAPPFPLLVIQEPTFEGLVKTLRDGRPSIGLFSDESGTFIGGHALNEENRVKMGAGLSTLWDGKPLSRVRAGDGAFQVSGRRASAHLMAQRGVAAKFLADGVLIEQGLISRFLACYPDSTAGTRLYNGVDLTTDPAMNAYHARIRILLRTPFTTSASDATELTPPAIPLSGHAKDLFVQFYNIVEEQLALDEPLAPIRGFANKAPEHAIRLATILTVFDDPTAREIDVEHMASGIELAQFYISEALRLFHAGQCSERLTRAQKLLSWIESQALDHIYLRLVYQYGPGSIRDAASAKDAAQILVDHGWLIPIEGGMDLDGAHRHVAWEVVQCSGD